MVAAFSFARGAAAIVMFKDNDIEKPNGKRDVLIITGATSSAVSGAFAAGKFGTRALSQSLAKEFGKENIRITHVRLSISLPSTLTSHAARSSLFLVHHQWRFAGFPLFRNSI